MGTLASEWLTAPTAAAPASSPDAAAPAPTSSLASEWLAPEEMKGRPRITVTPKRPEDETPTEAAVRLIGAHQGDDWGDRLIRLGAGAMKGIGDVADTVIEGAAPVAKKAASMLADRGVISGNTLSDLVAPTSTQGKVNAWANSIDPEAVKSGNALFAEASANSPMAQVGQVGGQMLATAPVTGGIGGLIGRTALAARPLLHAIVTGGATGAASNALTSAASDEPLWKQAAEGAAFGGALGPVGYGVSAAGRGIRNMLFGQVDPATARLASVARDVHGIPVSAGQISQTPFVRFADSVLQRLPFTGYAARTEAQTTGLNRAVAETFGEVADRITPDTIRSARTRIGAMFDDVAQRTGHIHVDAPFASDLRQVVTDASSVLPRSELHPLEQQVRNIVDTIDPHSRTISAQSYQALTRKGAPLDRAQQSSDPNVKYYASRLRDALDNMMERSAPPGVVEDLREARRQWKAMKTVEPLADKATTEGISPALLAGAVRNSYGGGGNALRDLGAIGQRFIKEPPSSGTSERLLAMHALGLGAGAIGASYFDPENVQRDLVLGATALAAGRAGSSALRSNWLANNLIRSPLPPNANALTAITNRVAPLSALTFRDRATGQ